MSAFLSAVLLWAMQVGAQATFPATVEVDLIFPRNDTYAPSTLFPIVFAFQNAALAPSLDPSLDLLLWDSTFSHADDYTVKLKSTNFTNEPTFVYTYISTLNTTADGAPTSYMLSWELGARNCSHFGVIGGGFRSLGVTFTIANGAPEPDLVGATANSALCTDASYFAFNLTGTVDVYPAQYDGRNSCAVLSDVQPLVDGDPCAVHVDSATASSISAALTATACADAVIPLVSCPSKQNVAAADTKTGFPAMLSGFVAALVAMQIL
ncbi:hypothetical protein QR685DRAFT_99617 [Neurospora intermedia]|uniref:DUF7136 domain-containing protein n=1 Tax=Neurospora intermedia TaxID=5142 RepID=A0ABR3D3Z9_NEUIN